MRDPKKKQKPICYRLELTLPFPGCLMISIDTPEQHFSTKTSSLDSSSHQHHPLNQDPIPHKSQKWTAQATDSSASPSQNG